MTTYWTKIGGNNAEAGTDLGTAWDAEDGIAKFLNDATTSDSLKVVANGTYAPADTLAWDGFGGAAAAYSMMIGVNELGVEDGTLAVINGGDIAAADCLAISGGFDYIGARNIRITGATDNGASIANGCDYTTFYNCRFDNAAARGVSHLGYYGVFHSCEFDACGTIGIYLATINKLVSCRSHGNTQHGVYGSGNRLGVIGCLVYRNGSDGLFIDVPLHCLILGNVFVLNTGDGVYFENVLGIRNVVFANNILASNGAYGLSVDGTPDGWGFCDYNLYYNNTSGATDLAAVPGDHNLLVDPQFISTTAGYEDFRLQRTSPCWAAGIGGAAR